MTATTTVMTVAGCYLSSALLLSILAVCFPAFLRWGFPTRNPERWLAGVWALLGLCLTLPAIWRVSGITPAVGAPVEIWNGPRLDPGIPSTARLTVRWAGSPAARRERRLRLDPEALGVGSALLGGCALFSLLRLSVRRRRLGQRCAELPLVKRVGRLRLCASDEADAPFAARAGGIGFIVVPTTLLANSVRLRMVVAHEAHHHRRGDLHAAALLGVLRSLFFWNPLLALWESAVAELQDMACDQRVIRRSRVSAVEYGRVLLWAAELVARRTHVCFDARGIGEGSGGSLKRRILMLTEHTNERSRMRSWLLVGAACVLAVGSSWVVQGSVVDHRVTLAQVEALAAGFEQRAGFPVLVDERVVAKLNEWVADPDSRRFIKAALERMPNYRAMIEQTLRAHGLPAGLLGMALAESAFDNEAHPDRPVEQRSAGIWQILPSTARQLGLEVSPVLDERLEPRKATEAAATLVTRLFARYGDWPVAIAAYNAGENKIDALVTGARSKVEVRERVLAGQDEHARYVRAVMASVILIEDPALLE